MEPMNSVEHAHVEAAVRQSRRASVVAPALAILGCLLVLEACVDINGGAAELSWSLRTYARERIETCADARINTVQLVWQPVGSTAAEPEGRVKFPCSSTRGVTDFVISEGPQLFWIEPICNDGDPPTTGTYEVPPPVLRTVASGEIVTLSSLLIVGYQDPDKCPVASCTCLRAGTTP